MFPSPAHGWYAVFEDKKKQETAAPLLFWDLDTENGEWSGMVLAADEKTVVRASDAPGFLRYELDEEPEDCPHCGMPLDEEPEEVNGEQPKVESTPEQKQLSPKRDFGDI